MRNSDSDKATIDGNEAIKRLLVLQLYISGVSTKSLGELLGVSYKTIERMLPADVKNKGKKNGRES